MKQENFTKSKGKTMCANRNGTETFAAQMSSEDNFSWHKKGFYCSKVNVTVKTLNIP